MLNFKLYVDDIFRTTIKGKDADDIIDLAYRIYGYDSKIKVVLLY